MTDNRLRLAAGCAAALLAMPAAAQDVEVHVGVAPPSVVREQSIEPPPPPLPASVAEVLQRADLTYTRLAGGDGPIIKPQFTSLPLPPSLLGGEEADEQPGRLFDRLDINSDLVLTRADWLRRVERDLARADRNRDGIITEAELIRSRGIMVFGNALGLLF